MTNEEVIENLKYLISDDCTDTQHDFVKEIKIAIEALEKQILKKPIEKYTDYDGTEAGLCPFCNEGVDEEMNFCSYCGQAIDWGVIE